MQPTAELARHHEIEAPRIDGREFRQAWRIATRLDRLRRETAISELEYFCAVAVRLLTERSAGDAHDAWPLIGARQHYRGAFAGPSLTVLDAIAALKRIRRRIGGSAFDLVVACAVDDFSWARVGRQLNIDPKTARTRTIAAIKALAGIPDFR
jgi:hypothetical protein